MNTMNTMQAESVILVGVDFSETSREALREGCRLAAADAWTALYVLHVVPPSIGDVDLHGVAAHAAGGVVDLLERGRNELQSICALLPDELANGVHPIVRTGTPSREIVEAAREVDADLIVIGTHGRTGIERVFLGSVSESVLRHAPCSVLTVRRKPEPVLIEAACPDCEAARAVIDDDARCGQHDHRHVKAHTYHETPSGFPGPSFRF